MTPGVVGAARGGQLWTTAALVLLALALRVALFGGFGGTDDVTYAARGLELAQGLWRPSVNVTELRFGVSLPIAATSQMFGRGDLALTAWSLACSALDVAAVCWVAGVFFGRRTAVIAGLAMAVVPLHVAMAGRALADAPFAAFATLAFAGFMAAAHRPSTRLGALAGAAAGVCWWIKPTATVPLFLALMAMPLLLRRWDHRWWWAVASCAAVIAAEWLLLWWQFGTPWLTLALLLPFLREHGQYVGDPYWGEGSPWFYFRRLLLDGRELWLLPHLALLGAIQAWARPPQPADGAARFGLRFVTWWAAVLLLLYSFFVISVDPLKFIPKQENYAVLFVAPLVLLAAIGLARLPTAAAVGLLLLLALGGLTLAGLQQQEHRAKYARLAQAAALAQSGGVVFVSGQTLGLARLRALQSGSAVPVGLQPWAALDPAAVAPGSARPPKAAARADWSAGALVVAEPASAELALPAARALLARLRACAPEVASIPSQTSGLGRAAVAAVAGLRQWLPPVLDRQLAFTDAVLKPPAAPVLQLVAGCAPGAAAP